MLIQIEGPTEEPVTRDRAKAHCRVTDTHEDELFGLWIAAARQAVERHTRLRLVSQTVEIRRSGFGGCVTLPVAPVQSIAGITYLDPAGEEQAIEPSAVRLIRTGALTVVAPITGTTWPATLIEPDTVGIRAVVGFGDAAAVPHDLQAAILMLVGHYRENREAVVTGTIATDMPLGVVDILSRRILWV